jgi:hypothetical protein
MAVLVPETRLALLLWAGGVAALALVVRGLFWLLDTVMRWRRGPR